MQRLGGHENGCEMYEMYTFTRKLPFAPDGHCEQWVRCSAGWKRAIGRRPEGASSAVLPGAYRLIDYLLPGPSAQVLPFLRAWLDPRLPLSNARVERGVSSGAARRVATEDHQPVDPPRRCHTHVLLYSPPASRAFLRFWGSVSAGAMYWQFCSNS